MNAEQSRLEEARAKKAHSFYLDSPPPSPYVSDAIDVFIVQGNSGAVNPGKRGTKKTAGGRRLQ